MAANERTTCPCGAPIFWAVTKNNKPIPIDAEPAADGNLRLEDGVAHYLTKTDQMSMFASGPRYVSHFATCPDAASYRKKP